MKKIIMLVILMIMVMSCSELAKIKNKYQQDLRKRGRECMYNYKGELQGYNYIN